MSLQVLIGSLAISDTIDQTVLALFSCPCGTCVTVVLILYLIHGTAPGMVTVSLIVSVDPCSNLVCIHICKQGHDVLVCAHVHTYLTICEQVNLYSRLV